jgi:hypothetical protein
VRRVEDELVAISEMRPRRRGRGTGSGESISAADAPLMARMSYGVIRSAERVMQMTCTSFLKPFGHSGRIGRSIMRAVRIGLLGRAPFALEEAARDLAGGVHPLFDVDGEREEVRALAGLHPSRRGGEHHRVARADDDAPSACLAILPDSKVSSWSPTVTDTVATRGSVVVAMWFLHF